MATGSAAAARERLSAAGYRTGRAQHESRCDGCAHCKTSPFKFAGRSRYDRYCGNHRTGVKTHGHCNHWRRKA